jgi:hypothetical protein
MKFRSDACAASVLPYFWFWIATMITLRASLDKSPVQKWKNSCENVYLEEKDSRSYIIIE